MRAAYVQIFGERVDVERRGEIRVDVEQDTAQRVDAVVRARLQRQMPECIGADGEQQPAHILGRAAGIKQREKLLAGRADKGEYRRFRAFRPEHAAQLRHGVGRKNNDGRADIFRAGIAVDCVGKAYVKIAAREGIAFSVAEKIAAALVNHAHFDVAVQVREKIEVARCIHLDAVGSFFKEIIHRKPPK